MSEKNGTNELGGHGMILTAAELKSVMEIVMRRYVEDGEPQTPLCIWGKHGIGKTSAAQAICEENGWEFAFFAPAQVEEMGDVNGMPMLVESDSIHYTRYAAPDWVPRTEGPGVLLLDDFNRADDRILRGLMNLFQFGGLSSWQLPKNWIIVCTANPEGDVYSVTSLDPAMLNRLANFTMRFEPTVWAKWASVKGLDERVIAFVLSHPELVEQGIKTTPRSLEAVSNQLRYFKPSEVSQNLTVLRAILMAHLDEEAVSTFVTFLTSQLEALVSPAELFGNLSTNGQEEVGKGALPWDEVEKKYVKSTKEGADGAAAVVTVNRSFLALFAHIKNTGTAPSVLVDRMVHLLVHSITPADITKVAHEELIRLISQELPSDVRQKALIALRKESLARKVASIFAG